MTEVVKRNPERFKYLSPDQRTVIRPDAPPFEVGIWGRDKYGRSKFFRITARDDKNPPESHT